MDVAQLLEQLDPVLDQLSAVDLSQPNQAQKVLERAIPANSPLVQELGRAFERGVEEGWLCTQEAGGARFSRVAKASEATRGFSIDAVRLSGAGVWHRHTRGEVDLCFARDAGARLDGQPQGWVVFGSGTDHVPTVSGGVMDILYFLPGGAMEWKR